MLSFLLLSALAVQQAVAWRPESGFDFHSGAFRCYDDGVLGCHMRGRGDKDGCCGANSVCLLGGDGLQQCEDVVASGRLGRHGHLCYDRADTLEGRDAMCEGYNTCAQKGKDGRTWGCDGYYCCKYPDSDEYWANYQEPPCVPEEGWHDSYGDTCEWYEAQIERCEIYGHGLSAPYKKPAMESCCYCQAGDAGGPAANEGNFCTWKVEDSIAKGWKVDLGATSTIYKDCWFFEQKGGRCRGSWGEQLGTDGLSAQEVCCVCRFGNIAQHWGRTVNSDGTPTAMTRGELAVGNSPLDSDDDDAEGLMAGDDDKLMKSFRHTDAETLNSTDLAVYGFAVVGLFAVGRAAFLLTFTGKKTHSPIPDQEI